MTFLESSDSFTLVGEYNDQWMDALEQMVFTESGNVWYAGIHNTYIEPFEAQITTIYSDAVVVANPPFRGDRMADWYLAVGDTAPNLRATLTQNEQAVDLTDATVTFKMRRFSNMIVDADADVLAAGEGLVEYDWDAGDTDLPGMHEAWFTVEWPDGSLTSFPGKGVITIQIEG